MFRNKEKEEEEEEEEEGEEKWKKRHVPFSRYFFMRWIPIL